MTLVIMIRSVPHKGLQRLFEDDDRSKVQAAQADRISRVLIVLNRAAGSDDMNLPGFRLHKLKGDLAGFWAVSVSVSVSVSGNWRIAWRFEGADAVDVDLIDYH